MEKRLFSGVFDEVPYLEKHVSNSKTNEISLDQLSKLGSISKSV